MDLPSYVFNVLHLHGFGNFVKMLPPTTDYPTFCHIYLSLSQEEQDTYLEWVDHALLPISSQVAHPVPPLAPLASQLSSPSPLNTPSSPTVVNSSPSDNDNTDDNDPACPIPCDAAQHIHLHNGTCVLSSPTCILPHPDSLHLTPTGPLTACFHCHHLGHYCEDCSNYTWTHGGWLSIWGSFPLPVVFNLWTLILFWELIPLPVVGWSLSLGLKCMKEVMLQFCSLIVVSFFLLIPFTWSCGEVMFPFEIHLIFSSPALTCSPFGHCPFSFHTPLLSQTLTISLTIVMYLHSSIVFCLLLSPLRCYCTLLGLCSILK